MTIYDLATIYEISKHTAIIVALFTLIGAFFQHILAPYLADLRKQRDAKKQVN